MVNRSFLDTGKKLARRLYCKAFGEESDPVRWMDAAEAFTPDRTPFWSAHAIAVCH